MNKIRIEKLLTEALRQHDIALRSQRRHSWRPGTATGDKDLERSHRASFKVEEALSEIRKLLA